MLFTPFGAFGFFEKNVTFLVKIPCFFRTLDSHPPTAYPLLGQSPKKKRVFAVSVLKSKFFGASNHHEMARYDLPTYVIYVSGHFWMFAVKITECVFFTKKFRTFDPHLPIVWDKVLKKTVFF